MVVRSLIMIILIKLYIIWQKIIGINKC
jgi:hypothetical protein